MMTADDLAPLCNAPAGLRVSYGPDPLQFGELSLPDHPGPHPLVVNIHGGVWLAAYSLDHSREQARALADAGYAVWNIEYRRVGNEGGGWPGTFLDVSSAVDYVRALAGPYAIDVRRVCLMGHSAGGHLALWAAARPRLPTGSELRRPDPLPVRGVVALAPATQLRELHDRGVYDGVVAKLIGGSPQELPERYAAASPGDWMPLGVRQVLIVGRHDEGWGWNSFAYHAAAQAAGDEQVSLEVVDTAGHFEVIAPRTSGWPPVLAATRSLLGPV